MGAGFSALQSHSSQRLSPSTVAEADRSVAIQNA